MPDERDGLAVGIPKVIRTRERWPSVVEMIKRSIWQTGKPVPEDFDDYDDFTKTLNPQEKRRRIDTANDQIVKLARQAVKTFRRAS